MFQRKIRAAAMILFLTLPSVALADPAPAKVITVTDAPVAITRCTWDYNALNQAVYYVANFTNRSPHPLISADIRFQFFDSEGAVGQIIIPAAPQEETLASSDSTSFTTSAMRPFTAPPSTVEYATCRIQSAKFTRGRNWSYGQKYAEKLVRASSAHAFAPALASRVSASKSSTVAPTQVVAVTLDQTWVSHPPNSGAFMHIRVTMESANAITVAPNQFHLKIALSNGASKDFAPLTQPAPRVLRGGLLTYTGNPNELTPSIAVGEDFGAIGSMSLQAKVPVTTVLTYQVDPVSQDSPMRNVTFVP